MVIMGWKYDTNHKKLGGVVGYVMTGLLGVLGLPT